MVSKGGAIVVSSPGKLNDARMSAARSFVRSLNILLKYARLYGCDHSRTADQREIAWKELCAAQPAGNNSGLLLGVAAGQLLLDGVPVGAAAAERSFAQLLHAAGLASVHFLPNATHEDFSRFIRAFMNTFNKPAVLAQQLKAAFGNAGAIRINQLRFVAQSGEGGPSLATQLAAQSLGAAPDEMQGWLQSPQKLLQMLMAAEGARQSGLNPAPASGMTAAPTTGVTAAGLPGNPDSGPASPTTGLAMAASADAGAGSGTGSGTGSATGFISIATAAAEFTRESDVAHVIQLLSKLGASGDSEMQPSEFQQQLGQLSPAAQMALRNALKTLATAPSADSPLMMQIAEHLAIKFALERYERGEVRVNAVREMLARMGTEMESLRKVLDAHEDKMSRAGMMVETHADILDRQFWASVPEAGKRSVLLSDEAWCIPPRNLAQYVGELRQRQEEPLVHRILLNYSAGLRHPELDARMKTALGLSELAELYGSSPALLQDSLRALGEQLPRESDGELQKVMSATFVRLSQEAAERRHYGSMQQAIAAVDSVAVSLPQLAERLRPHIGIHDRLQEFIDEALRLSQVPPELLEMLRTLPQATAEMLMKKFELSVRRDECERLAGMVRQIGPTAANYLKEKLLSQPPHDAMLTIGLLSRVDPKLLEDTLPRRLRVWDRTQQDVVIRQIASAGAPERGRLLLRLIEVIDPILLPQLVDEVGMSGDAAAAERLMGLAFDSLVRENSGFLKLKAIEALGRLRCSKAEGHLQSILKSRRLMRWNHPGELRIAAAQALLMVRPQDQAALLAGTGIATQELALGALNPMMACPWARQRRYPRVSPAHAVAGTLATQRNHARLQVNKLSLGGGIGTSEVRVPSGSSGILELYLGLRKVRAQVFMREERPKCFSFEIVKIDLDERGKLRRILAGNLAESPAPGLPGFLQQVSNFAHGRVALW